MTTVRSTVPLAANDRRAVAGARPLYAVNAP